MKKVFLTLLLVTFAAFSCKLNAQSVEVPEGTDTAFIEAVDKFMEVSGSKTTLKAQFPLIMNNFRIMLEGISDDVFAKIEAKFQVVFLKRAVELYAPFYERYYTLEDIKGLIAFYETELGRKVARTTPSLSTDLYKAGEQLGIMVLKSIVEDLRTEGYDIKDL
ncbi:DUF2059 domain-containing protein [Prevotella aurantiaca]|jgi:hypothetical protein|uniref:DUF2059 domain-containing protein n=1 Tax=Prevotella aurantiaca TaxID=596085 RepID=UPI001CB38B6C|nr:DUF2059 domain-containing protein [Prevotella aurantiaca]MBF1386518.1 DUF2059 domain-containing protein [Prevotella aurantiaca]